MNKVYLTRAQTRQRYNSSDRSISRWVEDPKLGFPKPITINNRWFFALDELEAFEILRASHSRKAA